MEKKITSRAEDDVLGKCVDEEGKIRVQKDRSSSFHFDKLLHRIRFVIRYQKRLFAPVPLQEPFKKVKFYYLNSCHGLKNGLNQPGIIRIAVVVQPQVIKK